MTKKKIITTVACSALVLAMGGVTAMAASGVFIEAKGGSVAYDGSLINDSNEVIVSDLLPEGAGEMLEQGLVELKEENGRLYASVDGGKTWTENTEISTGVQYSSGSFDNNGNMVEDNSQVVVSDSLPEDVGEMIGQGRVDLKEENGKFYSSVDGGKTWSDSTTFEIPAK